MAQEVDRLGAQGRAIYIHTGELADGAYFEPVSGVAAALDEVLLRRPNVTVEYRTKWADLSAFEHLRSKSNIVLAWTLSPEPAAKQFERGAPAVAMRVRAMAKMAELGFKVGLRLDPIIHFPGWREAYESLLSNLFNEVSAASIDKVVLGALRFPAGAEASLRRRLGASPLLAGEFILDREGRLRYHRFLRVRLYRNIMEMMRSLAPELPIELAMETDEVREMVLT
jgi:spore photoproduct lyase